MCVAPKVETIFDSLGSDIAKNSNLWIIFSQVVTCRSIGVFLNKTAPFIPERFTKKDLSWKSNFWSMQFPVLRISTENFYEMEYMEAVKTLQVQTQL